MADPTFEPATPRAQSPGAQAAGSNGEGIQGQQSMMSASGRMLPLTSNEDLATAQGRLQNEYAAIQRRAQELMSSMDIPG